MDKLNLVHKRDVDDGRELFIPCSRALLLLPQFICASSSYTSSVTTTMVGMCDVGEIPMTVAKGSSGVVAHGAIMFVAWLFLSPVASFIARQLKQQLGGPRWFDLHRYMQVCAVARED